MLTSLLAVPATLGYGTLVLLVGAESAGLPLPGETALAAAAVLAAHGHLELPLVIGLAAGAAIVGDNIGYLIGRRGIRRLLVRPGRWQRHRARLLEDGEAFFARHGGKAVFLGRWLTGVRVVVAWLAGADRMPWRRFLLWNALGGGAWAASIGVLAYAVGSSSSGLLAGLGFAGLAVTLVGLLAYVAMRRIRRLGH